MVTVKKKDIEEMKNLNTEQWKLLFDSKSYLRTILHCSALILATKQPSSHKGPEVISGWFLLNLNLVELNNLLAAIDTFFEKILT